LRHGVEGKEGRDRSHSGTESEMGEVERDIDRVWRESAAIFIVSATVGCPS